MKVSAHLIYLFLFTAITGAAQEPYEPGKVIPPSPTAASLGVYGDWKVGYYTGSPDITIPLYTATTGHHTLPIFMKYNATGFRVDEMASWVGLGWSLNAGGAITKTVRGGDDFGNNGYSIAPAIPVQTGPSDYPYFQSVANNNTDAEPDIYAYNFGEYSGKFLLGKNAGGAIVYMSDKNNLKVQYNTTSGKWTIITPNGYKYIFGFQERATHLYYSIGYPPTSLDPPHSSFQGFINPAVTTAWYLDQIIAPNGEPINFEYEIKSFSYSVTNRSESEYNATGYDPNGCTASNPMPSTVKQYTFTKNEIADVYLKKITFNNGSIEFTTSDRDDLAYLPTQTTGKPKKLESIIVKDNAGSQFRKFQFDYGYFTGSSVTKLKLNSIKELGKNNEANPPHLFTYNYPNSLFPIYTNSIDHWGFNNGVGNDRLLPAKLTDDEQYFDGADRTPGSNPEDLKVAVLASITYPTGGSVQYEYEPHVYGNLYGDDKYMTVPMNHQAYWSDLPGTGPVFATFDLDVPTFVSFSYGLNRWDPNANDYSNVQTTCARVFKDNNPVPIYTFTNFDAPPSNKLLQPGHYRIEAAILGVSGQITNISAAYKKKILVTQRIGGGLRVKSISSYANGERTSFKKYQYSLDDAGAITSGKLITRPSYIYYTAEGYSFGSSCISYAYYLARMSNSILPPYLTAGGAIIGYDNVKEIIGENGEGGSTQYFFHNQEEAIGGDGTPFANGYLSPLNGKLAMTVVRNANNEILRKSESIYETKTIPAPYASLRGVKTFGSILPVPTGQPPSIRVFFYEDHSNWVVTAKEIETSQKPGIPDMVHTTDYYYDNAQHMQVTRKEAIGSNGKTEITRYRYPEDYTDAPNSSFVKGMKDNNIVTAVVEQQMTVKTGQIEKLTGGSFTSYIPAGTTYKPFKIYKIETDAPSDQTILSTINPGGQLVLNPLLKEAVSFDQYDAKGNLNTYHKPGNAYQSYIWDKTTSTPIAEVPSVPTDQIAYTSFETEDYGGWSLNSGGIVGTNNIVTGKKTYSGGVYKTVPQGDYIVTAWAGANISVNGLGYGEQIFISKRDGNWRMFKWRLTNVTSVQIWADNMDEVRLYPVNAQMTTYTYDPLIGLISKCDAAGNITYYEYDGFARLKIIRDQDYNMIKLLDYQYQTPLHNQPVWTATGITRCKPCSINQNVPTNILQNEEKDTNPNSSSFGTNRWIDVGPSGSCPVSPDWQFTATPIRCRLVNGVNTGEQEREQKDMRPCSNGNTRWIVVGTNTTACPLPCTAATCSQKGFQCVNGICEQGFRVCTGSVYLGAGQYRIYYHYEFSDGSWSGTYTDVGPFACNVEP